MNDYLEVRFTFEPAGDVVTDLASALLAEVGFESFVASESGLVAYIPSAKAKEPIDYAAIFEQMPISISWKAEGTIIEGQDWNSEWEKHYFKPIVIDDQCVIHSSFHHDVPDCPYDIVIDPKMAFGTGHHATTTLMMRRLLGGDVAGKNVIDMGTGTGILAIMAAMLGAEKVTGIEIDPAAYINAVENIRLNGHEEITLIEGDASALKALPQGSADIFLANINRNIVLADMDAYAAALKPGGQMWLSGFYVEDVDMIRRRAEELGLDYDGFIEMDRWVSVKLIKR